LNLCMCIFLCPTNIAISAGFWGVGMQGHNYLGCHTLGLNLDLVQVHLRRKVGRDRLGTFAAFQMLLAKIMA
jgi:hypothetical protein